MNDQPERPNITTAVLMSSGVGMRPSVGVAAPVGAVSRKDRERASKTSLQRDGTSGVLLLTELPGTVTLQRLGVDGTWETLDTHQASRLGSTPIELPQDAASPPATFRVVFSPKNVNITAWISENVDA